MRDETTAAQRARSDAAVLTEDLKTLSGRGLMIVSFYRQIVEQLVAWGWTKIRAGEQVVNKPLPGAGNLQEQLAADIVARGDVPAEPDALATYLVAAGWIRLEPGERVVHEPAPRDAELSLRDELAATIVGARAAFGQRPVELAEHLISDGWMKLAPGERVVTPMSREEAFETVRRALEHWEALKDEVREKAKKTWRESAEVSADASELTSGVKPGSDEKRILAAFAAADRPLYFDEAAEAAAGHRVTTHAPETWDRWCTAFRSLYQRELIESLPAPEGQCRRYQLTLAGRAMQELKRAEG